MGKTRRLQKRVILLPLAVLSLLLGGCSQLSTEAESEQGLKEGQRIGKITVVSITGNELTYYEETEVETEAETETETAKCRT